GTNYLRHLLRIVRMVGQDDIGGAGLAEAVEVAPVEVAPGEYRGVGEVLAQPVDPEHAIFTGFGVEIGDDGRDRPAPDDLAQVTPGTGVQELMRRGGSV